MGREREVIDARRSSGILEMSLTDICESDLLMREAMIIISENLCEFGFKAGLKKGYQDGKRVAEQAPVKYIEVEPGVDIENMKSIPGYEHYLISREGGVYSTRTHKYIKPSVKHDGYRTVVLHDGNSRSSRAVHYLVAEAFIPNPDNLQHVCVRDGDWGNITVENLFWSDKRILEDRRYDRWVESVKDTHPWVLEQQRGYRIHRAMKSKKEGEK